MSKKSDKIADVIFEHYVKPYANNKTVQKMKAAVMHEMTCGDLSHMHGVIKAEWSQPSDKVQANTEVVES